MGDRMGVTNWPGVLARAIWMLTVLVSLGPTFLFGWRYLLGVAGGFFLASITVGFQRIREETGDDPFRVRGVKKPGA